MQSIRSSERRVISREGNLVRVNFVRKPDDPPGPPFPGAGALRGYTERARKVATRCRNFWFENAFSGQPCANPPLSG